MSEIGIEYKKIMEEIENAISNEKEKQFVKTKMAELSISFVDIIDRITKATDMKIKEMEKAQSAIEHKISNIETIVDNIEGDIYEDDEQDEDYEFEVVCPYCNYEFSVDMDNIEKDEIECPECHNIIELDWSGDPEDDHIGGCNGGCSSCHGCGPVDDLEDDDEENPDEFEDDM